MSRVFQRLLHVGRHRPDRSPSSTGRGTVDGAVGTLEDELPEPPPILQPAAIFRQYLYDPAEYTPEWARPRPKPEAAAAPAAPAPEAAEPEPAGAPVAAAGETAVADPMPVDPPKPAKRARRQTATGTSTETRTRSKRATRPKPEPNARSDETGGAGPT
jgi:hypothetical protein